VLVLDTPVLTTPAGKFVMVTGTKTLREVEQASNSVRNPHREFGRIYVHIILDVDLFVDKGRSTKRSDIGEVGHLL